MVRGVDDDGDGRDRSRRGVLRWGLALGTGALSGCSLFDEPDGDGRVVTSATLDDGATTDTAVGPATRPGTVTDGADVRPETATPRGRRTDRPTVTPAPTDGWRVLQADDARTGWRPDGTGPQSAAALDPDAEAGSGVEPGGGTAADGGTGVGGGTSDRPVEPVWSTDLGAAVRGSVAVADGTAYVGSESGVLAALSVSDPGASGSGPTRALNEAAGWTHDAGAAVRATPTVADGVVYCGDEDGRLTALDASDGRERWSFAVASDRAGPSAVRSGPVVADGTAYVGATDGRVYAVDVADGAERWRVDAGGFLGVATPVALAEGRVFAGSYAGRLYAFDAETGRERWYYAGRAATRALSGPSVADGVVYAGASPEGVLAVDALDGTERWRRETGGPVFSSPAVAGEALYVGTDAGAVLALDTADGTERWRREVDGAVRSSPAVVDGRVYVGTDGGSVLALDAADGTERWQVALDGRVTSSPAVVGGRVYVGDGSGGAHALGATER
ncbi:PQQ-binding-like beta-propeller repeat protein [Halosimplex litoreum]|uniref:PQQ-binding-like beta-propeller repeat protein n=1 Tax=Halosimplex litoreum TaxID=1198301 RepID=A0A7T3G016_9EURY|nr:PQQ-binding-like beta-propeller repeat protein [Halosimplex litoreum]QPV63767.1 PQQ-binding-like beta-propeller repeat protein [Halosimplex litoreum]